MKFDGQPGDVAEVSRRFSASDVASYVALGGAPARPGRVPEPLIWALFSQILGMQLPGLGTNYLKQDGRFEADARLEETLVARVTITRIRADKQLVDLETLCHDAAGSLICRGRALVYVGDVGGSAAGGN